MRVCVRVCADVCPSLDHKSQEEKKTVSAAVKLISRRCLRLVEYFFYKTIACLRYNVCGVQCTVYSICTLGFFRQHPIELLSEGYFILKISNFNVTVNQYLHDQT